MNSEQKNCSKNCYAVIALCVSFLALGLLIGNWIGQCAGNKNYNKCDKKYGSYSTDGKSGSTCDWSKTKQTDSISY